MTSRKNRAIRTLRLLLLLSPALLAPLASAADWPMAGGSPQHNGWAGSESLITKANVNSLKLLYRHPVGNGSASLTAPIIDGNLITYLGFKEMLMFTSSTGSLYSIDADLNHTIWEAHLPTAGDPQPAATACPGGLSAPLITAGSSSSALHFASLASRAPAAAGVPPPRRNPYFPPLSQSLYPLLPTTLTQLNALYTVSPDGNLHVVNSSTGQDLMPPIRFLPPHAYVTSLNLRDNVVYATTANNCDGYRDTLYALDLLTPEKTIHTFSPTLGGFAGSAGTTIGNDGTVYVQASYSPDGDSRHALPSVIALTPKDLQLKDYFVLTHKAVAIKEQAGITPVVFSFQGRDGVIAGSPDGHVYLLDSRSLGGQDHKTPLFASAIIAKENRRGSGLRGSFSTWFDTETGSRRFYAPIFTSESGSDTVIAFALKGSSEAPTLETLWTASQLTSPAPPVIANRMLFVLSTGEPHAAKSPSAGQPATLQVFDAVSGNSLYSGPGSPVSSSLSAGLALANGRIYFTARDGAVYCFGIPAQQSQLKEQ